MKAMSARPPVRVNSHLMILKSFKPHLQLIVVNNNLEGIPASGGCCKPLKTLPFKKHFTAASVHARHDQERRSSRSGSSSSVPQWTNAVNVSSSESSMGFQRQQRYWLVLSRHSQPWKADREGQHRLLRPRSLRPPVREKFLWEQIRLSTQACNSQPSSKAKKPETELLGR